jgi:hypothetical protein
MDKCVTCQYFDRKAAKGSPGAAPSWGQCRRSAPQLNPIRPPAGDACVHDGSPDQVVERP